MEDMTKLPKWAQQKINQLNGKIKELEHLNDRYTPTKVSVNRFNESPIFLPDDRYISFALPSGKIEAMIKDDVLHVYAYSGGIVILPQVTNVVNLKVDGR